MQAFSDTSTTSDIVTWLIVNVNLRSNHLTNQHTCIFNILKTESLSYDDLIVPRHCRECRHCSILFIKFFGAIVNAQLVLSFIKILISLIYLPTLHVEVILEIKRNILTITELMSIFGGHHNAFVLRAPKWLAPALSAEDVQAMLPDWAMFFRQAGRLFTTLTQR